MKLDLWDRSQSQHSLATLPLLLLDMFPGSLLLPWDCQEGEFPNSEPLFSLCLPTVCHFGSSPPLLGRCWRSPVPKGMVCWT